jgi:hypothetical protein
MNGTNIQQRFSFNAKGKSKPRPTLSKDAKIHLIAAGRFIQN